MKILKNKRALNAAASYLEAGKPGLAVLKISCQVHAEHLTDLTGIKTNRWPMRKT